jgi:hypothetical protein
MGRRITDLAAVLDLFEGFEESMYRLEALQVYDVAYERARYDAFLAAEPIDLAPGPWQEAIRRHRDAGRAVERVHVVFEPLTDYVRYEIATSYRRGVAAGEFIAIIPATAGHWPAGVPTQDYWLFDDREVWAMEYDSHGRFVVAEHRTQPAEIQDAVHGKRNALAAAIPLDSYLATSHPVLRHVS